MCPSNNLYFSIGKFLIAPDIIFKKVGNGVFRIILLVGILVLSTTSSIFAETWIGTGTAGSSGTSDWFTGTNWDSGDVPVASDDVVVTLNTTTGDENIFAMEIGNGAVGKNVVFGGLNNHASAGNPFNGFMRVRFTGNATFETLMIDHLNSGSSKESVMDLGGNTITLTGGSSGTPTYDVTGNAAAASASVINGTIRFTGSEVHIRSTAGHDNVTYRLEGENAVVDFGNTDLQIGNSLEVRSDQTFQNTGVINFGYSSTGTMGIYSIDGGALDNFSGITLNVVQSTSRVIELAEGTYGALQVNSSRSGSNNWDVVLKGDFRLDSKVEVTGTDYTLILNRGGVSVSSDASIVTDGYNITAQTGGEGAFMLSSLDSAAPNENFLDMSSGTGGNSTVTVLGDFIVGENGYVIAGLGADAELIVGGDFMSNSVKNSKFDGTGLTLTLAGVGTAGAPQFLEVFGADFGAGAENGEDNFFINQLVIGQEGTPTYVSLTDAFSFNGSGDDALYVGNLEVHEGSVLDLQGLKLYVDGTLLLGGETGYGLGTIVGVPIPEPSSLLLFVLGGFGMTAFRRRRAA